MQEEDKKLLSNLASKMEKLIDEELGRYELDRAYFNFKVTVDILSADFKKMAEATLVDDSDSFCEFCNAKTSHFDHVLMFHMCADCFAKTHKTKIIS